MTRLLVEYIYPNTMYYVTQIQPPKQLRHVTGATQSNKVMIWGLHSSTWISQKGELEELRLFTAVLIGWMLFQGKRRVFIRAPANRN